MESGERRPKPGCWRVGCLSVLLLWALLWAIFYLPHDWDCWQLQRSFEHLQQPSGTRRVMLIRNVDTEVGNGDYLDYFVGELRSYSGPREHVKAFYADKTIYDPILRERTSVSLAFVKSGKLEGWIGMSVPRTAADMAKSLGAKAGNGQYYVVYVLSGGGPPLLDIRGY